MRVSRKIQNMLRRARKADPVYRVMSTLRSVQTPQKRQVREAAEALYLELRSRGAPACHAGWWGPQEICLKSGPTVTPKVRNFWRYQSFISNMGNVTVGRDFTVVASAESGSAAIA